MSSPWLAAGGLCFGCSPDTCRYPDCNMGRKRVVHADPITRTIPSGPVRHDLGPHYLTSTACEALAAAWARRPG